jgi:hypothetical protein
MTRRDLSRHNLDLRISSERQVTGPEGIFAICAFPSMLPQIRKSNFLFKTKMRKTNFLFDKCEYCEIYKYSDFAAAVLKNNKEQLNQSNNLPRENGI